MNVAWAREVSFLRGFEDACEAEAQARFLFCTSAIAAKDAVASPGLGGFLSLSLLEVVSLDAACAQVLD